MLSGVHTVAGGRCLLPRAGSGQRDPEKATQRLCCGSSDAYAKQKEPSVGAGAGGGRGVQPEQVLSKPPPKRWPALGREHLAHGGFLARFRARLCLQ